MKRDATPIKDITKGLIKEISKERRSREDETRRVWQEAVGEKFSRHTQVVSFRGKKLLVNVDSSSWLYELTMRKQKIKAKLKDRLKDDFKELRLRIGAIEEKE